MYEAKKKKTFLQMYIYLYQLEDLFVMSITKQFFETILSNIHNV
jgi:hypothetical protein